MDPSQVRTYSRNYHQGTPDASDFLDVIHKIPVLTKIGALCLVMGKFFGILAIPAAFIPSLNVLVVPFVIIWGGLVFISVALCSVDHFHHKKLATRDDQPVSIVDIPEKTSLRDNETDQEYLDSEEIKSAVVIPLEVGHN